MVRSTDGSSMQARKETVVRGLVNHAIHYRGWTQVVPQGDKIDITKQFLIIEFWGFLKYRKKYWLLPIIIVLLLMGSLIVFTESSAIAPFIYTLF